MVILQENHVERKAEEALSKFLRPRATMSDEQRNKIIQEFLDDESDDEKQEEFKNSIAGLSNKELAQKIFFGWLMMKIPIQAK